jgi:hypothetical protein
MTTRTNPCGLYGIDFVEGFARADHWARLGLLPLESPEKEAGKGFTALNHLTHDVEKGSL